MREARHVRTAIDIRKHEIDKIDAKIEQLQRQRAAALERVTELYAELRALPQETEPT